MKLDRRGGGRLRRVASGLLGIALLLVLAVGDGDCDHIERRRGGEAGRVRLPGHQGLVPPGATLIGPAPNFDAIASHRHVEAT